MEINERKYIAISIKHSIYESKRLGGCMVLWGGYRTKDDEARCFSGYTANPQKCEIYSLADFQNSYGNGYIKCDEPVKMTLDICKRYKKFDTVVVAQDEYLNYFKLLGIESPEY